MADAGGLHARVMRSLSDAPRDAWQSLFGRAPLGYAYYRACELAPPPAFEFGAAGVFDGERLVAGAPLFKVTFKLAMSLEGGARSAVELAGRVWPRLVNIPILGAGSPHAEQLALGFAGDPTPDQKRRSLAALLDAMDRHAAASEADVMVLKDVRDCETSWAHEVLAAAGFARTAALPVAMLDLPFKSTDDYLVSLSQNQRSNMRRKLKKAAAVRVEIRDRIDDLDGEISRLFDETRAQAKASYDVFEELAPGYFASVLREMPHNARIILYWLDEELIAFSLVAIEHDVLVFLYIGMRYPQARDYNIYFLNWMVLVGMCIQRGIGRLHAGQSTYLTKVRLGCRLERNWIYYRHRKPFWNWLFHRAAPYAAFDKMDPDLAALGAEARYQDAPPGKSVV